MGQAGGLWSAVTLRLYLAVTAQVALSAASVRRVLVALGFRWRRPKLALPSDPEAAPKLDRLATTLLAAPADARTLALDECDVHLVPTVRAMWMRRGRQAAVMTPGSHRKRGVCGALVLDGPCPGAWHYAVTERKRTGEFLAFLEQLVTAYPARPLYLVLDNASIHTAKRTRAWLAGHAEVTLCFLPAYAGHRENPVEQVWWRLKQEVTANRVRYPILSNPRVAPDPTRHNLRGRVIAFGDAIGRHPELQRAGAGKADDSHIPRESRPDDGTRGEFSPGDARQPAEAHLDERGFWAPFEIAHAVAGDVRR